MRRASRPWKAAALPLDRHRCGAFARRCPPGGEARRRRRPAVAGVRDEEPSGCPDDRPLRFARWVGESPIPVYALGGIDAKAARRLQASGVAGFAAIAGLVPPSQSTLASFAYPKASMNG